MVIRYRNIRCARERFFRAKGKSHINLDVAGGNEIARTRYESLGYLPISTSMSKSLDRSSAEASAAEGAGE